MFVNDNLFYESNTTFGGRMLRVFLYEFQWFFNSGPNGAGGSDAFTTVTTSFIQPAVSGTVSVEVGSTAWASAGQDVFVEWGGYYLIALVLDATHLALTNRGYNANSVPTTVIPIGSIVTPTGEKGEAGSSAAGNFAGVGSPEGVQTASVGSTYTDTTAPYDFWVKVSGSGDTGWVMKVE